MRWRDRVFLLSYPSEEVGEDIVRELRVREVVSGSASTCAVYRYHSYDDLTYSAKCGTL